MASTSDRTNCAICNKEKITYLCQGCSQRFCLDDLPKHRQNLSQEFDQIQNDHNQFRQNLNDQKLTVTEHSLIKQIDQWEKESIDEIRQTAQQCREQFIKYSNEVYHHIEQELNKFTEKMEGIRQENEFNELDLNALTEILDDLQEEYHQPSNVSIQQQSISLINDISLLIPLETGNNENQIVTIVAGGNGEGRDLDQFLFPCGICIDDQNRCIYIADFDNGRIMEWQPNAFQGRIVVGENGKGSRTDQIYLPTDLVIDRNNDCFIIADHGNKRVMRWPRQGRCGQILISNIDCGGLAIDKDGSIYVSDWKKNEVKRWRIGEKKGTLVAGGNGQGNNLNQLHFPSYLFVDNNNNLYVSDRNNHRVMKWMQGAKEGIIVAGGNGQGNQTTHLSSPEGIAVSSIGEIFISDSRNGRVVRWHEGAKQGTVLFGGNVRGDKQNQLSHPSGLLLDTEGNIYVVDYGCHRVQKCTMV